LVIQKDDDDRGGLDPPFAAVRACFEVNGGAKPFLQVRTNSELCATEEKASSPSWSAFWKSTKIVMMMMFKRVRKETCGRKQEVV